MRLKVITFGVFAAAFCSTFGFGNARLGVRVVDSETGHPLPDLRVHGGFLNYSPGWGVAAKDNGDEKITDQEGFCRLSGNTERGESCCIVRGNEGFYNSGWYSFDYKERSLVKLGRWLPDDVVVTVRLDRVINPIPMYVRVATGEYRERSPTYYELSIKKRNFAVTNDVPVITNEKLAYDLIKGSWLPPHGDGEVCDIQFVFDEEVIGWKEGRGYGGTYATKMYRTIASISLPGRGNGIIEMPVRKNAGIKLRSAPEGGYEHNISRWRGWFGGGDGDKTDCDKNRGYAFRVRTEYDDKGNIKSALYGKIYGDFDMLDIEGVRFLYYLNPTPNDRNLEWDREHNLCPKQGGIGIPQP